MDCINDLCKLDLKNKWFDSAFGDHENVACNNDSSNAFLGGSVVHDKFYRVSNGGMATTESILDEYMSLKVSKDSCVNIISSSMDVEVKVTEFKEFEIFVTLIVKGILKVMC